ncbi:LrgB family protein [Metasolibacillus fluoroglycofenilyticus]|uniref:LrgB family protein n=1 Tax=Metasolibacillus fluoroglycofenilyticus TaxID=1239396 RepID=UPI000D3827FB|nr:LrgB family protein [Metasolibacillus fluoroglycofenilyticus]
MLGSMQALLAIVSTIGLFLVYQRLYMKWSKPYLLPILITAITLIILLIVFKIPYATYMQGGQWIHKMLGPAVVALAYPLYNQRKLVFQYKYSIISSLIVAMFSGLISVFLLLKGFKASQAFILTALPKSLTTPIAMQVSETIDGIVPLSALLVMIAGFTGALLGPVVYKLVKIDTAISRGVSLGSASHGVGVSKLTEYGEKDVSIGSLAMGLSAVLGAFICPLFAMVFL